MCRVTRTGVDRCLYSDALKYGCFQNETYRQEKAWWTAWSLPIRPALRREEAFNEKTHTPPNTPKDTGDNIDKKE